MNSLYLLIALGVAVADDGDVDRQSINLAVLVPIADDRRPFSAVKLRPAVDLAVGQVSNFIHRHLRVSYGDSNCSEIHGMNEAINYFISGSPNIYFGPICDFAVAPVARQSYFWDIPVVSVGALAIDFLNKRRASYQLLTRAGPVNLVGLTDAILEAMHVYGWRRVKLLYERETKSDVVPLFCHLASEAVVYMLESKWSKRVDSRDYHKFDPDAANINFEEVLVNEVGHVFAGT